MIRPLASGGLRRRYRSSPSRAVGPRKYPEGLLRFSARTIALTPFWLPLNLTLADLSGVGEGIFHSAPDMAWNFDTVSAWPGHERNLMAPYFATYRGDCIAEGQECFWIPGGGSGLELS